MASLKKFERLAQHHFDSDEHMISSIRGIFEEDYTIGIGLRLLNINTKIRRGGAFVATNKRLLLVSKRFFTKQFESLSYCAIQSTNLKQGFCDLSSITCHFAGREAQLKWRRGKNATKFVAALQSFTETI